MVSSAERSITRSETGESAGQAADLRFSCSGVRIIPLAEWGEHVFLLRPDRVLLLGSRAASTILMFHPASGTLSLLRPNAAGS